MRISDWSSDVCSSDLCQGRCACGCPDRGDHGGKEDGRSYPALPSAAPVRGHRRSASDGGRRTRECERTDHSYDGRGNGSNDSSFCSLLTVYDMVKSIDRGMTIEAVRLVSKSGGRSGDWKR